MKKLACLLLSAAALYPVCVVSAAAADDPAAPAAPAPAAPAASSPEKPAAPSAEKPAAPSPEHPAAALPADQQAVADAHAAREATNAANKTAREKVYEEGNKIWSAIQNPATPEEERKAKEAELDKLRTQLKALETSDAVATTKLAEAFGKSDWDKWDLKTHAKLVEAGLDAFAEAGSETRPADVVKAVEWALKHLASSEFVKSAVAIFYPDALVALGDLTVAESKLKALYETASVEQKPALARWIGDFRSLAGDASGAAAIYDAAIKLIPLDLGEEDPRAGVLEELTTRRDIVGKQAPEINSKTWLGSEPCALSSLKGKVVVLDFWATWCPPCRMAMPGLDALSKKYAKEGLNVWGVCKQERSGDLPKTKEAVARGPYEKWRSKTGSMEEFIEHLTAFRKVSEISYPFVVSTEAEQLPFHVSGIPTMFVIGKSGAILFVQVGYAGNEHMLEAAIKAALKHAAPAKAEEKTGDTTGKPAAAGAAPAEPAKVPEAPKAPDAPKEAPKPAEPASK